MFINRSLQSWWNRQPLITKTVLFELMVIFLALLLIGLFSAAQSVEASIIYGQ